MAIKAVLYRLLPDGSQPYSILAAYNISFNGGICEKNGVYLGVATGELADMQAFAQENTDFEFLVRTKQEAIDFYTSCLPAVIEYEPQPTKQEMIDSITAELPG